MPGVLLQPSTNYERQLLVDALSELGWTANQEGNCLVQWCKARDIDWQAVLRGEVCANSLLVRTALTRKVCAQFVWFSFYISSSGNEHACRHSRLLQ